MKDAKDLIITPYEPLDTDQREIRLMTLSPGEFSDDIHCSLTKASLNSNLSYEALSYVWGVKRSGHQIPIDGIPKTVTENLEIAIRYLRYTTKPRVLWIDAICINQKDTEERNFQVIHMDSVYKSASRVIAWLGEEAENSNLAFDALENLPAKGKAHWDPRYTTVFDEKFLDRRYRLAILDLLHRPWWHRLWTVQESGLASILTFVCGYRQISADTLHGIERGYNKHFRSCCRKHLQEIDTSNLLDDCMGILDDLNRTRLNKGQQRLITLLATHRARQCIDPRDKIYGLLGLCNSGEKESISPNYFASISSIYAQASLTIIQLSRSLEVFSLLLPRSFEGVELVNSDLPSWVPNWTAEVPIDHGRDVHVRQFRTRDYNASSASHSSVVCIDQTKLVLYGIIFGSVAVLSPSAAVYPHNKTSPIFEEWRNVAGFATSSNRTYPSNTSTTYYDAYWQTICCSILPSRHLDSNKETRSSDHSYHHLWYDAWWSWLTTYNKAYHELDNVSSEYTGSEIAAFDMKILSSTNLRKLFLSDDKGWLGLAPMDAEVGDKIVLLEGGRVPYILRPKRGSESGTYELVGDAYVHGIMDGEAWNTELLKEIVLV